MGSPEVDRVPEGLKRRWPDIRPEDRTAVAAVLERGVLGGVGAPEMTALEAEWAAFVGRDACLLFNSGTAAIHSALYAIGIEPGDEVITTAYTFAGTWQPILHQGATPVFVDIDPRTFDLDPRRVEAAITPRTKAIIAVHIGGLPADLDELIAIADRHGLYLVEDACQAHGATYHGRQVGSFGIVGCYSLNSSKILSGGEGGLLVADDPEVLARARRLRVFGEDIPELQKLTGWNFRPYTSHSIGWNYRHQEMPAALARSQLQRLPEYIATGQRNAAALDRRLAEIPGITPPYVPADRTSSYYQYRVRLDPSELGLGHVPATTFRDALGKALMAAGVGVELWHTQPAPAFPVFQERGGYDLTDYPEAVAMLDSSLVICEARYPIFVQPLELIELYAESILRTIADPERFLGRLAVPPPVPA
ncbi:MAG TPA: DegT/DnrJ/EryC1/StrS family aminotransferase [Candidatus Limnocylindrales bacterium]|nr:DegT/DnrJ/EryC1/StrS family aminotransferase [Candidatus Limnocylindrales bacterium]